MVLRKAIIFGQLSTEDMPNYGKQCGRCHVYFVSGSADVRLCQWCEQIVGGHVAPDLMIEQESIQGSA